MKLKVTVIEYLRVLKIKIKAFTIRMDDPMMTALVAGVASGGKSIS